MYDLHVGLLGAGFAIGFTLGAAVVYAVKEDR